MNEEAAMRRGKYGMGIEWERNMAGRARECAFQWVMGVRIYKSLSLCKFNSIIQCVFLLLHPIGDGY